MKVACPKCGQYISLEDNTSGDEVGCTNPECWHVFRVSLDSNQGSATPERSRPSVPVPPPPIQREPPPRPAGTPVRPPPLTQHSTRTADKGPPRDEDSLPGVHQGLLRNTASALLSNVLTTVRGFLRVRRLERDIRRLCDAESVQFEALGVQVDQCRPTGWNVDASLEELEQLRAELGRKESSRKVLQKTGGSRALIRAARREARQLKQRQHELLVALGQEAFAARPEMPDAGDDYASLETIQQTRTDKEKQLRELGVESADREPFSMLSWLGVLTGAGVGVLLVCLAVVCLVDSSPTIPSWAEHAASDDAIRLMRVNLTKLQGDELFREFMKSVPPEASRFPGGLEIEDLEDAFVVFTEQQRRTVARTSESFLLDDFAANRDEPLEFRNVEYVPVSSDAFPGGYLARTGDRTFSVTVVEDEMRDLLTRLDSKSKPRLVKELEEAARSASREDHFVAQLVDDSSDSVRGIIGLGVGASFDASSFDVRGTFVFRTARNAERFVDEFQDIIDAWSEEIRQQPREKLSEEARAAVEDGLELFREAQLRQRNRTIHFRGTWNLSDIEDLISSLPQIARLF